MSCKREKAKPEVPGLTESRADTDKKHILQPQVVYKGVRLSIVDWLHVAG